MSTNRSWPRPYNVRLTDGYRHEEPLEGTPTGLLAEQVWELPLDQIVLRRWDRDTDRHNSCVADDSSASVSDYRHATGLEMLACPACRETLTASGRWGEAAWLRCNCGFEEVVAADWGRHLLQRLILSSIDPGYEARRLLPQVSEERQAQRRLTLPPHTGPDDRDAALVASIDSTVEDLAAELIQALQPRLPQRHGGDSLTLLLIEAGLALSAPAVRDSAHGRRLTDAVRSLIVELQDAAVRFAWTRRSVVEQLDIWQQPGGPPEWQDAWDRLRALLWPSSTSSKVRNGVGVDGMAGLLVALYLIARTQQIPPEQVTLQQVRVLAGLDPDGRTLPDRPAEVSLDLPAQWAARLEALGHDLQDRRDPVTVVWQHLQTEHTLSDEVAVRFLARQGNALVESLPRLLCSPSFYLQRF